MPGREDIVTEARSWIGTPFKWQAAVKGRGCDCKGLVVGVARELGLPGAESIHARMAHYAKNFDPRLLRVGLAENMDKIESVAAQPGDVLLLKMKGRPIHLGILGHGQVIHTYGAGPEKVLAHPVEVVLRRWQLDSVWRFRGISA